MLCSDPWHSPCCTVNTRVELLTLRTPFACGAIGPVSHLSLLVAVPPVTAQLCLTGTAPSAHPEVGAEQLGSG